MADATLPAPLTEANCDLRGFGWFQLHHRRLRGSSFWKRASDAAKAISVDLWCEAWEQVPAASLPDDDHVLSDWAGYGCRDLTAWLAVKAEVLSAWVLCDDGRWYHPTLSEVARQAWADRQDYLRRREGERLRKEAYRASKAETVSHGTSEHVPRDVPSCPTGKPSERERERDRDKKEKKDADASSVGSAEPMPTASAAEADLLSKLATSPARAAGWQRDQAFKAAWDALPKPMHMRSASRERTWPVWVKAALTAGGPDRLLAAVQAYVAGDKDLNRPGSTAGPGFHRWLADGKWEHWLTVADAARPAATWTGPPELRTAVLGLKGPDWCVGYFDRCGWQDVPERTLVSPNSFVTRIITSELGDLLARSSVTLQERRSA